MATLASLGEGGADGQRPHAEGHADLDHGLRRQVADGAVQGVGVGDADVATEVEASAGGVGDRRRLVDLGQQGVWHLERWFVEVSETHGARKVSEFRRRSG